MGNSNGRAKWLAQLVLAAAAMALGCSAEPCVLSLASPDGSWEVRVFIAGKAFNEHVRRVAISKDGRAVEELAGTHSTIRGRWVEAIGDDGALYLGIRGGHTMRLSDVFVYREGVVEYLGRPGGVPTTSRALEGAIHPGTWWSGWEREMRADLESGPAVGGLRFRIRPEHDVFGASEPARLELSLLNVGSEAVQIPPDALDQVWGFTILNCPGDQDDIKRRTEPGAWGPDQQRKHTLKPGETMRTTIDLKHHYNLPPGPYRLQATLNHNWRRRDPGATLGIETLLSNEFQFIIDAQDSTTVPARHGKHVNGLQLGLRADRDNVAMRADEAPSIPLVLAFESAQEGPLRLNTIGLSDLHLRFRVRSLGPDSTDSPPFRGFSVRSLPDATDEDVQKIWLGKPWKISAKKRPHLFAPVLARLRKPGQYAIRAVYSNTERLNKQCGMSSRACWTGLVASNEIVVTVQEAD
jgi:hypothetical protein